MANLKNFGVPFVKVIGTELNQWETGRKVLVNPYCKMDTSQLHFTNKNSTEALVVVPREESGALVADIPNILLQSDHDIIVYSVYVSPDHVETIRENILEVTKRPKPSDYVYTETEILNYASLDKRIEALEKGTGGGYGTDHPVKYIESPKDNKVCIRDLDTGNYVLSGYFKPFPGSNSTLIISGMLMHLYRANAGTYMTSLSADGEITIYEILVDETNANGYTYTKKKFDLNETQTEITEAAKDTQFATAKAVYNLFKNAGSCHITRIVSDEETGIRNLRELESGIYILYGYFNAYPEAETYMPFDNRLVTVEKQSAGSHLFVFQTLNARVDFHEILVDETQEHGFTHTWEKIDLLSIDETVNQLSAEKVIGPENAKVGQVIAVKAVDENGKPTELTAVDMGEGGSGVVGVPYEIDNETLVVENNVLRVNTTNDVQQDNTQPITSAAVYTTVGNIEILLGTI